MTMSRIVQGAQRSIGSNVFVATPNANDIDFAPAPTTPATPGEIPTLQPNTVWKVQVLEANMKADGGNESCDIQVVLIEQGGAETILARLRLIALGNGKVETINRRGIGRKFRIPNEQPATVQLRAVNRASGGGNLPLAATATLEQAVPDGRLAPWLATITN